MDPLKKDELTQLLSQMNIEVNNEWSNVLELHQELQKLLNSCNTEARHSWAIIDKVRRSASTVTLELSDLEKELSNDITLSTNYRFTSDVDLSHSHPKSDLKYAKTSSCHTSLLSLFHLPLPDSDTLAQNVEGLAKGDLRQMRLQFQEEGNLERSTSSKSPHKNCKESFMENGKSHEVNTTNLDGVLTNDNNSIQLSDESKNSCQKSTAIDIINNDIIKCENEYIQQLRQQYLEKRDNDTIMDKNRLFYKMANNYKPIGYNSSGIESSQTNSNNADSDTTNIVHLYKEHTLYKVCLPPEILDPPEINDLFLRNCKSLNDLYSLSNEMFEETSTTIINVKQLKENKSYEHPKWFEIPKCISEICVQSAKCYYRGKNSKLDKVSSLTKSKLKRSEGKCCIRCKKSIQDINHVKWDNEAEVCYIGEKDYNLFNSLLPVNYMQKNCYRCKKAMPDTQIPYVGCQLMEKSVETQDCGNSLPVNQPLPVRTKVELPKTQDQCCYVEQNHLLGNNVDKELKDQFCQTDIVCDVCLEKKNVIYQLDTTKNSVACQNNEIEQQQSNTLSTVAYGIINDLKDLSASKLCRSPSLIKVKAFPIPFEKDLKPSFDDSETQELYVSVLNASTNKYNQKSQGISKKEVITENCILDRENNNRICEGEKKETHPMIINPTKFSDKTKSPCTDDSTMYNSYQDMDKINKNNAQPKQENIQRSSSSDNVSPTFHGRPQNLYNFTNNCYQQSSYGQVPNVLTVDMDKLTGVDIFTNPIYSIKYDECNSENEEMFQGTSSIKCSFGSEPISEQTGPEICCDNIENIRNIEECGCKIKRDMEDGGKFLGNKCDGKMKKIYKTGKDKIKHKNGDNPKTKSFCLKIKTQKYPQLSSGKGNTNNYGIDHKHNIEERPPQPVSQNETKLQNVCNESNIPKTSISPVKFDMNAICFKDDLTIPLMENIPDRAKLYDECQYDDEIEDIIEKQLYYENPDESLRLQNGNIAQCINTLTSTRSNEESEQECINDHPSYGVKTDSAHENVNYTCKPSKLKQSCNDGINVYFDENLIHEMENEPNITHFGDESTNFENQTNINAKCTCVRSLKNIKNIKKNICDQVSEVANEPCNVKPTSTLSSNNSKMETPCHINELYDSKHMSYLDSKNNREKGNPPSKVNDREQTIYFNQQNTKSKGKLSNKVKDNFLSESSSRKETAHQSASCKCVRYDSSQMTDDSSDRKHVSTSWNIENLSRSEQIPEHPKLTIGGQFGTSDYQNHKKGCQKSEESGKSEKMEDYLKLRINSVNKSSPQRKKKCNCKQLTNSSNGSDGRKLVYCYCKCKKSSKNEKPTQSCKCSPAHDNFVKTNKSKKAFISMSYRANKDMNVYTTTCFTDNSAIEHLQKMKENSQNKINSGHDLAQPINDQNNNPSVTNNKILNLNSSSKIPFSNELSQSENSECSNKIVRHISKYGSSKIKSNFTSRLTKYKGHAYLKNIKHIKARRTTFFQTNIPTQAHIKFNKSTNLVRKQSIEKNELVANFSNKLWQESNTIKKDTLSYVALTPFHINKKGTCVNSKSCLCSTSFCINKLSDSNFSKKQLPMWSMGCMPNNLSQISVYKKENCLKPSIMCMQAKTNYSSTCNCVCNQNALKYGAKIPGNNYSNQTKPYNFVSKEDGVNTMQKRQFGKQTDICGDKSKRYIANQRCEDQIIQNEISPNGNRACSLIAKESGRYNKHNVKQGYGNSKNNRAFSASPTECPSIEDQYICPPDERHQNNAFSSPRGKHGPYSITDCADNNDQQIWNNFCNNPCFNEGGQMPLCPEYNLGQNIGQNFEGCIDSSGQQMIMDENGQIIPYPKDDGCNTLGKQKKQKNTKNGFPSSTVKDISTPMPINHIENRSNKHKQLMKKNKPCPPKPSGCYTSCPLSPKCAQINPCCKIPSTTCQPLSNLFKRTFTCTKPPSNKTMCPFYPPSPGRQLMVASGQCGRISQNCLNSLKTSANQFLGFSNYRNKICNTATISNDKHDTVDSANICNVLALCENVFGDSDKRFKYVFSNKTNPKINVAIKKRDVSPVSKSSFQLTPFRMSSKIVRKTKTQLCQTEISIPKEVGVSILNPLEFGKHDNGNCDNKPQNDILKLDDINMSELKKQAFNELPNSNSTDINLNEAPDYNYKISFQIQKQCNNNISYADEESKKIDNKLKCVIESIENKVGLNKPDKIKSLMQEENLYLNCKKLNIKKNILTFCSQTDDYKLPLRDLPSKKVERHNYRRKIPASGKIKKKNGEKESVRLNNSMDNATSSFTQNEAPYKFAENFFVMPCSYSGVKNNKRQECELNVSSFKMKTQCKDDLSDISEEMSKTSTACDCSSENKNAIKKTQSKCFCKEVQTEIHFPSADSNLSKSKSTCAQTDVCECFAKDACELLDIITSSLSKQNKLVSTKNDKNILGNLLSSSDSSSLPTSSVSTSQHKNSNNLNTNGNSTEENSQQNQQSLAFNCTSHCTFVKNHKLPSENYNSTSFFIPNEHKCELAVQTSLTDQISVVPSTITLFNSPTTSGNHFTLITKQCTAESESSKQIITQEQLKSIKSNSFVTPNKHSLKPIVTSDSQSNDKPEKCPSFHEQMSVVSETNFAAWTLPDLRSIKNDVPNKPVSRKTEFQNRSNFIPAKKKKMEDPSSNSITLLKERYYASSFAKWSLPDHRTFKSQSALNTPIINFEASEKVVPHSSKSCPHYQSNANSSMIKENSPDENEILEELNSEHEYEKNVSVHNLPESESAANNIFEGNNDYQLMPLLIENCTPASKYDQESSQTDSFDQDEIIKLKHCKQHCSELNLTSCGCHLFDPKEGLYCKSENNGNRENAFLIHKNLGVHSKPKISHQNSHIRPKQKLLETSKETNSLCYSKERKCKKKMLTDAIYDSSDRNIRKKKNNDSIEKQKVYLINFCKDTKYQCPMALKAKRKKKISNHLNANLPNDQIEKMVYIQELAFNEKINNTCIPAYIAKKNHKQWIRYQAKNSPTKSSIISSTKSMIALKKKCLNKRIAQLSQANSEIKRRIKRENLNKTQFECEKEDCNHTIGRRKKFSTDSIQCCVEIKRNPKYVELQENGSISKIPIQSHSTQYEPRELFKECKEKITKDASTSISKEEITQACIKPCIKMTSSMSLIKTKIKRAESDIITHSTHNSQNHNSLKSAVDTNSGKNVSHNMGSDIENLKTIHVQKINSFSTVKFRAKSAEHLDKKSKIAHNNLLNSNISKISCRVLEKVKDGNISTGNKKDGSSIKNSKMIQTTSDFANKEMNKSSTNTKKTSDASLQTDADWLKQKNQEEDNKKSCSSHKNKMHISKRDASNQLDKVLDLRKNKCIKESKHCSSESCPAAFYNQSSYLEEIKKKLDSLNWLETNSAGQEKDPTKAMMDFLFNLISPPLPQKGLKKKDSLNSKCNDSTNLSSSKNTKNVELLKSNNEYHDSKTPLNQYKNSKLKLNSGPSTLYKTSIQIKESSNIKTSNNTNKLHNKIKLPQKKYDESSYNLKGFKTDINLENKSNLSKTGKLTIKTDNKSNAYKFGNHKASIKLAQVSKYDVQNSQMTDLPTNMNASTNNVIKIISVLPEGKSTANTNNIEFHETGSCRHDKSAHLLEHHNDEVRLFSRNVVNRGVSTYNNKLPQKEDILGAIDLSPNENILKTKIFNPILGRYTEIYRTVQTDNNKVNLSASPHWIYDITDNTIKLVKRELSKTARSHSLPHVTATCQDHKGTKRSSSSSHRLGKKHKIENFNNFKIIDISKNSIASEKLAAQMKDLQCENKSNKKVKGTHIQLDKSIKPTNRSQQNSHKPQITKVDSFTCIEEKGENGISRKYILDNINPNDVEEENKSFYRSHNSISRLAEPDFNFRDYYEREQLSRIDGGLAIWRMEATYEQLNEKSENIFDKIAHNCYEKHEEYTKETDSTSDKRVNHDQNSDKKSETVVEKVVHDSYNRTHECTSAINSACKSISSSHGQILNKNNETISKEIVHNCFIRTHECTENTELTTDESENNNPGHSSNKNKKYIYETIILKKCNSIQECSDNSYSTSGKSVINNQNQSSHKNGENIYKKNTHDSYNRTQECSGDTDSTCGKSVNNNKSQSSSRNFENPYQKIVHDSFSQTQKCSEDSDYIYGKSVNNNGSQSTNRNDENPYQKIAYDSFSQTQKCIEDSDSTSGKSVNHDQSQSSNKKNENIYGQFVHDSYNRTQEHKEDMDSAYNKSINHGHGQISNRQNKNNFENVVHSKSNIAAEWSDDTYSTFGKSLNQDQSQSFNKKSVNMYDNIVHESFNKTQENTEDSYSTFHKSITHDRKLESLNKKSENIFEKILHNNCKRIHECTEATNSSTSNNVNYNQNRENMFEKIVHCSSKPHECMADINSNNKKNYDCNNQNFNKTSENATRSYSEQGSNEKSPTVTCEMNFRTLSTNSNNELLVIKPAEKWQMTPSMMSVIKKSSQRPVQDGNNGNKMGIIQTKQKLTKVLNITSQNNLRIKQKRLKKLVTNKKANKSKKSILINIKSKSKNFTSKNMSLEKKSVTFSKNEEVENLSAREKKDYTQILQKDKQCFSVPSYSNCPDILKYVNRANVEGDYFSNCRHLDKVFNKVLEIGCSPIDKKSQTRSILRNYLKALNKLSYKLSKYVRFMKLALEQENQLELIKEFSKQMITEINPCLPSSNGLSLKERKCFVKEKNSKKRLILFNIHKELSNVKYKINNVYAHFLKFKTCLFHVFKYRDEQEKIFKMVEVELSKLRSIEKQIVHFVLDVKNQLTEQLHHAPYDICDNNYNRVKEEMLVKAKLEKLAKTKARLNEKLKKINTLIVTQLWNKSNPEKMMTSEIILKKKLEHIGAALRTELANISQVLKGDKSSMRNHAINQ